MNSSLEYFKHFYRGIINDAPMPSGLAAEATGNNNGMSSQCQCDCYECAGGDTSDDY